jgi:hypothetical protein
VRSQKIIHLTKDGAGVMLALEAALYPTAKSTAASKEGGCDVHSGIQMC